MSISKRGLPGWLIILTLLMISDYPVDAQKHPKNIHYNADSTRLITGGVPSKGLYDEKKLESIYLEFTKPGFWDTLTKNHDTGTDTRATLKMNGKVYPGVGVRFKGMTSYMMTGDSFKKSFNISIDFTNDSLRLMGLKP